MYGADGWIAGRDAGGGRLLQGTRHLPGAIRFRGAPRPDRYRHGVWLDRTGLRGRLGPTGQRRDGDPDAVAGGASPGRSDHLDDLAVPGEAAVQVGSGLLAELPQM